MASKAAEEGKASIVQDTSVRFLSAAQEQAAEN